MAENQRTMIANDRLANGAATATAGIKGGQRDVCYKHVTPANRGEELLET